MSEARNLTLERVNRLSQAVADLMESHAAQGRMLLRRLDSIDESLTAMKHAVRDLASEQTLLSNRIEEASRGRCVQMFASTTSKTKPE